MQIASSRVTVQISEEQPILQEDQLEILKTRREPEGK
jgi:hypothetical protein